MADEGTAVLTFRSCAIIGIRLSAERIHIALESVRNASEEQRDVAPRFGLDVVAAGPMTGAWFDLPCVIGVSLTSISIKPADGRRTVVDAQLMPTLQEMQETAILTRERLSAIGISDEDGEIALWMCGEGAPF